MSSNSGGTASLSSSGGAGVFAASGGSFGAGGGLSSGGATMGTGGLASGGTGGTDPGPLLDLPPAIGVSVDDVHFNQAVGGQLVIDGQWVPAEERKVPLIAGRDALVQVSWSLSGDYQAHDVEARLTIQQLTGEPVVLRSVRTPAGTASLASADGGAFSFQVLAEQIGTDSQFSLSLHETTGAPTPATPGTRFPAGEGLQSLDPWQTEMSMKVMIVPASTTCAAAPVFDAEMKKTVEDFIYNLYPIALLEVRYHDVLHIDDSCGEGDAMALLEEMRDEEALGPEWYYQAHFSHESNTSSGGFGWVFEDDFESDATRVSWAQNWAGEEPVNTAHELGHNHGSDHTFSNGAFPPYEPAAGMQYGGRETYGYALTGTHHPWVDGEVGGRIFPPTIDGAGTQLDNGQGQNFYDAMSYEQPYWVSAFTYYEWARRIQASADWDSAGSKSLAVETTKIYVGEGGHRSFRSRRARLGSQLVQAQLRVGEVSLPVAVQLVWGCGDQLGSAEFATPSGVDLAQSAFSLVLADRTLSHQVGDRWR